MSVSFRKWDGKWAAQVGGFPTGVKRRSEVCATEHDALIAEQKLTAERDRLKAAANQAKRNEQPSSLTTDAEKYSLGYWIELTAETKWRNVGNTMPRNARTVAKHTDPKTDIRQINLQWLDKYVRYCREKRGLSDQTINCHLDALYVVLRQAHKREVINRIPFRPEGVARSEKSEFIPEPAWIEALIIAFDKHNFARKKNKRTVQLFCRFLRLTGVRTTEALQLKWSDISFAKMNVVLRHKPSEGQQIKNKKTHTLPVWSELEKLLVELKRLNPHKPFPITYTVWYRHFTEAKQSVVESLRLPESVLTEWTGHRFRALSCTEKADMGWDAFAIKDFHNHSDLKQCQHYVTKSAVLRARVRDLLETQAQQVAP